MDPQLQRIQKVLEVYNLRGAKALERFRLGDIDEAIETMVWRKGAFHNYLVLDREALSKHPDYHWQEPFLTLLEQAKEDNLQLAKIVEGHMQEMESSIRANRGMRSKLNKFKSLNENPKKFQKQV